MKKRIVAVVMYAVASLSLAGFLEALYGSGPVYRSWLVTLAITSATFFALAGVLSAFNQRWGIVVGLAAAVLSWPGLVPLLSDVFRGGLFWYVRYRPENVAASLSLPVATIYSMNGLRLLLRGGRASERGKMTPQLVFVLLYGAGTLGLANWHAIWDWLFSLRYGVSHQSFPSALREWYSQCGCGYVKNATLTCR
jgi:hypothetical protein